jgi:4-amino-4-deoxy-L-arabinose transferase-like glycosyltransferase
VATELACILAVLALGASLVAVARDPDRGMQPDEPLWITAGAQAFALLIDTARPGRWERAPLAAGLASFGNANPPVGKYWIGALAYAFRGPDDPLDYAWDPAEGPRERAARGTLPSRELVLGVRTGMAALATGCLLLCYVIAREVTGARALALAAPLLLATSAPFAEQATTVATDVPQLFWLLAGLACWLRFLAHGDHVWLGLAAAGFGLSCAAKYSSGAALVGALAFCALRRVAWRARLAQGAALAFGALAAFWVSTPYLYTQPIAKQRSIVAEWSRIKGAQREEPALLRQAIGGPAQGLRRSAVRAILRPAHPALPGLARARGPVNAIGLANLIGAAVLLSSRRASAAPARRECALALLAVLGASLLVTGIWLPFDWPRYYLPLLVLSPVLPVAALRRAGLALRAAKRAAPR